MKKVTTALYEIAYSRSGDKGNSANIALFSYTDAGYPLLVKEVTIEKVMKHFQLLTPTRCDRFEVPNLNAINFLLHNTLGGGASQSLRTDSQGKVLGIALLEMTIEVDPTLLDQCKKPQSK